MKYGKRYEADFCIKYSDKESEEIGITDIHGDMTTRYSQGMLRRESPVNRNEPRNNLNRPPRNYETESTTGVEAATSRIMQTFNE